MNNRFDFAQFYYWRVELIEPDDPDDNRYVMLHGDCGEVTGPLTIELAQSWINHFSLQNGLLN